MATPLGRTTKTPSEIKRYKATYGDWLDTDELVVEKVFTIELEGGGDAELPEIVGDTITDDGTSVTFMISGGDDGNTYEVHITVTTDGGQVKEDVIQVTVSEL